MVAEPAGGAGVAARYFTPLACHEAMAVTGGICIATACMLPGTVADGLARIGPNPRETIVLEHPTGRMEAVISTRHAGDGTVEVLGGGTLRTTRKLMAGEVFIPARIWPGKATA
jgi:2-methylaconitate cis-trans-isomerase PrpF